MLTIQKQVEKLTKASQILREHGKQFRQIRNYLSDGKDGRCAVGVILSYNGWDGHGDGWDLLERMEFHDQYIHRFAEIRDILIMNDNGGYTFNEIADWLEEKGL